MSHRLFNHIAIAMSVASLAGAAPAQEPPAPGLAIELNAAESREDGCTLSFLVRNGHEADIETAVFETVLFDAEGQVERLTLFDFGALPAGRPRVRQFVVPGPGCEGLGRVLFNGAETCEAPGLGARACDAGLSLTSRTGIEVLG